MIDGIEDITPGKFKSWTNAIDFRDGFDSLVVNVHDSGEYDYYILWMARRQSGYSASEGRLSLNDVLSPTFNTRSEKRLRQDGVIGGLHSASSFVPALNFVETAIAVVDYTSWFKKNEDARRSIMTRGRMMQATDANSFRTELEQHYWDTTDDLTEFGLYADPGAGSPGYNLLIRVYRIRRNMPITRYADMIHEGDLSTNTTFDVDPVRYQSIGMIRQASTGVEIDFNENESTNFYNHCGIRNATTNGTTTNPPAIDQEEDIITTNVRQMDGNIIDIPDTKRSFIFYGGGTTYDPSVCFEKGTMIGSDPNPISKVTLKHSTSIAGHVKLQRDPIFPFFRMFMDIIYQKRFSQYDLSTELSINIPSGYKLVFFRIMLYDDTSSTLQAKFNGVTSYTMIRDLNSTGGANHTSDNSTSFGQMFSETIAKDGQGNFIEGYVHTEPQNNLFGFTYWNTMRTDQMMFASGGFSDTTDLSTMELQTTATSSVNGMVQLFGVP